MASWVDDLYDEKSYEACDMAKAEDIQEGDYVLFDTGRLGSQTGVSVMGSRCIGVFESEDKARAFIQGCMEAEQYFPNIWYVNDHGNYSLLDK